MSPVVVATAREAASGAFKPTVVVLHSQPVPKLFSSSVFLLGWVTNSDFDHARAGIVGAHVEECVVRCIGACTSTQISTTVFRLVL